MPHWLEQVLLEAVLSFLFIALYIVVPLLKYYGEYWDWLDLFLEVPFFEFEQFQR